VDMNKKKKKSTRRITTLPRAVLTTKHCRNAQKK